MLVLAIDPGANGAIAWVYKPKLLPASVEHMPDGESDLYRALRNRAREASENGVDIVAYVEKVGSYHPGNSATAAVKFALHVGHIGMALTALKIPREEVPPNKWMRALFGSALPKDKAERKRYIKREMEKRYPHLTVTLKNADALGILTYALKQTATTE